jgi:hypothetical protein
MVSGSAHHPGGNHVHSRKPLTLLVLSVLLVTGCHGAHVQSRSPTTPPPSPHARRSGPPPHAPAHGYRRKFAYTYYPGANVYHASDRGVYFWIESGSWKVGARLPSSVRLDAAEGIAVELDTDTPGAPAAHVSAHPSGKSKWHDR